MSRADLEVGADCHDVLGDRLLPQGGSEPGPDCACVEHGLRCGESLGHHDHQCCLLLQALQGVGYVNWVHIGQAVWTKKGR